MNPYQIVRIVALLAVIFVCGLITGRLTAPRAQGVGVNVSGRPLTAEAILASFKTHIPMTTEEELKMRRHLEQVEGEIASHPVLSQERLDLFRVTVAYMKETLSAEKHAAIDRYAEEMERQFEINRRRRGLPPPSPAEKKP